MKSIIIIFCFLLISSFYSCGFADTGQANQLSKMSSDLSAVIKQLKQYTIIRSHFTQRKKLEILKNPLISNGYCIISAAGISWQMSKPIPATYLLNDQGIFEIKNGTFQKMLGTNSAPAVQFFTSIFDAILKSNFQQLNRQFKIQFSGSANNWQMILTPLAPLLKKMIQYIVLKGNRWIKVLTINEGNHTITELTFDKIQTEPSSLTDQEKGFFEF